MDETLVREEYDTKEVRRSFTRLFFDVTCFHGGHAVFDPSTILPIFLSTLTGSSVLIGLITAIRYACNYIPQLWSAHYLRDRARHKSYLIKVAMVSRTAAILYAILLFAAGPSDKALLLGGFIFMYTAFWLSEGYVIVSWNDLVAKTIPPRMRGRLFGYTQMAGSLLAIFIAVLANRMLGPNGPAYPTNYAVLYAVAALLFSASLVSLSGVREPDGSIEEHYGGFIAYLKRMGGVLAGHRELKSLIAVQLLIGLIGLSLPFYILHAAEAGVRAPGLLLAAQLAGSILWSGLVGLLNDRRGPKAAICATALAGTLAPGLALFAGDLYAYCAVFFFIGATTGTSWIGVSNYLLEIARPEERRSLIGVLNTANAPTLLFPVIGGLVVQFSSYFAVFALTGIALLAALVLAIRLGNRP
ncbi:MAG: MFS transporter [Armatimonadota bacterium]